MSYSKDMDPNATLPSQNEFYELQNALTLAYRETILPKKSLNDAIQLCNKLQLRIRGHQVRPQFRFSKNVVNKTDPIQHVDEKNTIQTIPMKLITDLQDNKNLNVTIPKTKKEIQTSNVFSIQEKFNEHIIWIQTIEDNMTDILLENLEGCIIILCSPCSAIRATNLNKTIVVANSVNSSFLIYNCNNSLIIADTQQMRIHNAQSCSFFVSSKSSPIIEDCLNLQFGNGLPFSMSPIYLNKDGTLPTTTDCKEDAVLSFISPINVVDFNWHNRRQNSPNWRRIDIADIQFVLSKSIDTTIQTKNTWSSHITQDNQDKHKLSLVDAFYEQLHVLRRSEYDRGVNTFSPEGRLFQVEYALGAVKLGSTSIGIKTSEGVVLVTERRIQSKLMEAKADAEKLREIDTHIGCASSGIIADARIIIDHARVESQHHFFTYNEKFPVESCVAAISELALEFSGVHEGKKKSISRPFGVALLIAGVDSAEGPSLWCADPSGTTTKYEAAAIGSAQEGAEALLQEKYHSLMTLKEAEEVALIVLRQVMEEKLTSANIEMASIPANAPKFHVYDADEVKEVVNRLPEQTVPTAATTLRS